DKGHFTLPGSKTSIRLPASPLPGEGAPATLGIRPEHFGPSGDVIIPGRVTFVETHGRENLYDVQLDDGSVLRSIQPVRDDVAVGDQVQWGAQSENVLVFGENGDRL